MRSVLVLLAGLAAGPACVDPSGIPGETKRRGTSSPEERKAAMAELVENARTEPAALAKLLGEMPKGAELHSHLSGAVATESLVGWARRPGLCLVPGDYTLVEQEPCPEGSFALADVEDGDSLLARMAGAWSMRGQSPGPFEADARRAALAALHSHFFGAFLKFHPVTRGSTARMIAEVRKSSARERVGHVELMVAFGTSAAGRTAASVFAQDEGWAGAWDSSTPIESWRAKYVAIREKLAKRLAPQVEELEEWEAEAGALLGCDAVDGTRDPGCDVDVRYLVQLNRTQTREHVFGQLVYAMELARSDDAEADRIVGLNLALAEEDPSSLRHYEDDMYSIAVLRALYRELHPDESPARISLHAGELVPELLAEDGSDDRHLAFHIRSAVSFAGEAIADRIGHGTDILREDPDGALRSEMAARGVLVEACLTSNDWLLDVRGEAHPLESYLEAGVPVALATDDAGVFGTTLTDELVRAVLLHGLGYAALERMARSSIEHAFLPGTPFEDDEACREALVLERLEAADLEDGCAELVQTSPHARLRWTFERDLLAFERSRIAAQTDGQP